jgi:hypothetical protein
MATKAQSSEISILEVTKSRMEFCILGTMPLILNRMSEKAKYELLLPKGRKNAAEKASSLKHDPLEEFRASPYKIADGPTLLGFFPTAFKKAMMTAALDMPGAKKAQIGRLINVDWQMLPIYGVPKLFMSVVRSADMNKTPDVRSRAIVPEWACRLAVEFPVPLMKAQSIANLLASAGFMSGIGDWRQEKGSGSYGSFKLVSADDPDFVRITATQGRQAQIEAMANPEPFDMETEELMSWFDLEVKRRGFKVAA